MNVEVTVDSTYKPFQILKKQGPRFILLASEQHDSVSINCRDYDLQKLRKQIDEALEDSKK